MNGKQLILGTGLLALVCGLPTAAQQNSAHDTKAASHLTDGKQSSKDDKQDEGQRIFAQRCSNCHNAPEGFSPRISGTVVRHMRVRALLSQHEEEELLRFFNP